MIQCSECQSRIRVKNPNLIGRLVSCPKCEAKLSVVPPQQIRVETATGFSADSTAMTKDGIAPEMIPSLQKPESSGENADEYRLAEAEAPEFQDVDSILASHTESVQNQEWQDDGPLLPSDEWTSAESTKNRQYLLIAVLGVTGVVFAIIAFFAFLNWFGKPNVEVAGDPASSGQSVASPSEKVTPDPSSEDDAAEVDLGDESPLPTDPDADSDLGSVAEDSLPPNGDDSEGNFSAEPEEGPVETGSSDEGMFEPNDPFADSVSEDMSADDVQEGDDSLLPNPWLQQFAPMLDWQVTPTIDDLGGPPGPAPITAEDMGIKSVAGREPLPAVDLVQKSQVVIPGLIMGDSNLSQAIQMFTQVSGIPTTVNLDSLKAAKIDTSSGYAFGKFQATSVGQVVQQVGAGAGFALTPKQNEFLELRATNENLRGTIPAAMKVDDLITSDEDREWLVRTLAQALLQAYGCVANRERRTFGLARSSRFTDLVRSDSNDRRDSRCSAETANGRSVRRRLNSKSFCAARRCESLGKCRSPSCLAGTPYRSKHVSLVRIGRSSIVDGLAKSGFHWRRSFNLWDRRYQ